VRDALLGRARGLLDEDRGAIVTGSDDPVVVVGGGAAAVFVVRALVDQARVAGHPAPRVVVVGSRPDVGRGLAYGAAEAHHRLNSPAGSMSVSTADPDGFVRWLGESGWHETDGHEPRASSFAPRVVFGDYLAHSFAEIVAESDGRVVFRRGEVVDVDVPDGASATVTLATGETLTASAVVLALGNPPPVEVPTSAERVVPDPWAAEALDAIDESDRVLLVGTGLTMVDVATSLARRHPGIRMVATSRHLLLPAVHPATPAERGPGLGDEPQTLSAMMRAFRDQLRATSRAGAPWQGVLDGVRPQVQTLWRRLSLADRQRFLAHVARPWDVARHRMAIPVAEELARLVDAGVLTLEPRVDHATFDVAVLCTGPHSVASAGWSPLVDALLGRGILRADPTGLGVDADADGALLDAGGRPSDRLFTVGAALKGALWETVASPEIRQGAGRIAGRLAPAR
jgi:uncharacterized NAD(P)/FAD-binding protein YdhS